MRYVIRMTQTFLPRWFTVWFYVATLVLFAGGLTARSGGAAIEGFDPLGASIGVFVTYLLTLLVWRFRDAFSGFVTSIRLPAVVLSVAIGWFFSQIDELVNFPFNPLYPGITLGQDLFYASIMYVPAHIGWFWVLRRYAFTPAAALMTGGLSLALWEVSSGGAAGLLAIFIFPFAVMIHGPHMVMPKLGLGSLLTYEGQKETKWKYVLGVAIPAIGVGLGAGLALGVAVLLQGAASAP
jgi:hypothetical protein